MSSRHCVAFRYARSPAGDRALSGRCRRGAGRPSRLRSNVWPGGTAVRPVRVVVLLPAARLYRYATTVCGADATIPAPSTRRNGRITELYLHVSPEKGRRARPPVAHACWSSGGCDLGVRDSRIRQKSGRWLHGPTALPAPSLGLNRGEYRPLGELRVVLNAGVAYAPQTVSCRCGG